MQRAPQLWIVLFDGLAITVQLSGQHPDEFLFRVAIAAVMGSKFLPGLFLG